MNAKLQVLKYFTSLLDFEELVAGRKNAIWKNLVSQNLARVDITV